MVALRWRSVTQQRRFEQLRQRLLAQPERKIARGKIAAFDPHHGLAVERQLAARARGIAQDVMITVAYIYVSRMKSIDTRPQRLKRRRFVLAIEHRLGGLDDVIAAHRALIIQTQTQGDI